jgi:hypothetical protein
LWSEGRNLKKNATDPAAQRKLLGRLFVPIHGARRRLKQEDPFGKDVMEFVPDNVSDTF